MIKFIFEIVQGFVGFLFKIFGKVLRPFSIASRKFNAIRKGNNEYKAWAKKENKRYRRQARLNDEIH